MLQCQSLFLQPLLSFLFFHCFLSFLFLSLQPLLSFPFLPSFLVFAFPLSPTFPVCSVFLLFQAFLAFLTFSVLTRIAAFSSPCHMPHMFLTLVPLFIISMAMDIQRNLISVIQSGYNWMNTSLQPPSTSELLCFLLVLPFVLTLQRTVYHQPHSLTALSTVLSSPFRHLNLDAMILVCCTAPESNFMDCETLLVWSFI